MFHFACFIPSFIRDDSHFYATEWLREAKAEVEAEARCGNRFYATEWLREAKAEAEAEARCGRRFCATEWLREAKAEAEAEAGCDLCTTERLREAEAEAEAEAGCDLCTTERLREAEAEVGGLEHDDQDLALPAFARTAVPLTSTSRAGGLCRSWASKGVCGSSLKCCTEKTAQTAALRFLPSPCFFFTAFVT